MSLETLRELLRDYFLAVDKGEFTHRLTGFPMNEAALKQLLKDMIELVMLQLNIEDKEPNEELLAEFTENFNEYRSLLRLGAKLTEKPELSDHSCDAILMRLERLIYKHREIPYDAVFQEIYAAMSRHTQEFVAGKSRALKRHFICRIFGQISMPYNMSTLFEQGTESLSRTEIAELGFVLVMSNLVGYRLYLQKNAEGNEEKLAEVEKIVRTFENAQTYMDPKDMIELVLNYFDVDFLDVISLVAENFIDIGQLRTFSKVFQTVVGETGLKCKFPKAKFDIGDCRVCCENNKVLFSRGCCQEAPCMGCVNEWIKTQLLTRKLTTRCLSCSAEISPTEIFHLLGQDYQNFVCILVDLGKEKGDCKTCPNCNAVTTNPRALGISLEDDFIQCEQCGFGWCYLCHAPEHPEVTCEEMGKLDSLLEVWSNKNNGMKARRCPNKECKVLIEKSEGCSHMTCRQCEWQFCYFCLKAFTGLSPHNEAVLILGYCTCAEPELFYYPGEAPTPRRRLGVTEENSVSRRKRTAEAIRSFGRNIRNIFHRRTREPEEVAEDVVYE